METFLRAGYQRRKQGRADLEAGLATQKEQLVQSPVAGENNLEDSRTETKAPWGGCRQRRDKSVGDGVAAGNWLLEHRARLSVVTLKPPG